MNNTPKKKRIKKIIKIVLILFLIYAPLRFFGWVPNYKIILPNYFDRVTYKAPVWQDNEHILFIKEIHKWKDIGGWLIFENVYLNGGVYLCSMNINGSEKKEIFTFPEEFSPGHLSYHKDVIVVSGGVKIEGSRKGKGAIATLHPHGKEYVFNIVIAGEGMEASVSKDGEKIVYNNNDWTKRHGDIHIMDIEGKNIVKLTDTDDCGKPLFSPDGTMIAYERYIERKGTEIWLMNADGTEKRKVYEQISPRRHLRLLDWFNDSKRLWTNVGSINMQGKLLREYGTRISYEPTGFLSPDNNRILSGRDRYFYILDIKGRRIYDHLYYDDIQYGKFRRSPKNNVWIKE